MPLSINVGLSRKASRDYQSAGVSINVTAELDQSLLAKPDELQKQIGDLYAQADSAMKRQVGLRDHSQRSEGQPSRTEVRSNGERASANGNGHGNGAASNRPNSNGNGSMTASQRRAILAICDRAGIDLQQELRDIAGNKLDDLTIRQASEFIDHLKAIRPAANGN